MRSFLLLYGEAPGSGAVDPADPSRIDLENLVHLYLDGDLELGGGNWKNQVGDKANMVFGVAGVTIEPAETGLNGHAYVKTVGGHIATTAGGMTIATPVITKATAHTTYIVYRVVAHVGNKHNMAEGTIGGPGYVMRSTAMALVKDGHSVAAPQAPTAGKWVIDSWVHKGFDGVENCQRRLYVEDGADTTGALLRIGETTNIEGYTLGRDTQYYGQLEADYAYMMVYAGEHSTETQDAIFTSLRLRFDI